jgi:hypothetical protein
MASDNNERRAHVKWAGPNSPFIRMTSDDRRLYLSKRELVALMHEIESFVHYYRGDFTEERIDIEDEIWEPFKEGK